MAYVRKLTRRTQNPYPSTHCVITALLVILTSFAAQRSGASTISVTTLDDELNNDGDCSLREAITAANGDSAVDSCEPGNGDDIIDIPEGTYLLTITGSDEDGNATGDLDIISNVTVNGAGSDKTVIDGGRIDRVLHVLNGATVVMNRVQITNGRAPDGYPEDTAGGHGGGIYNSGTLNMNDCELAGNISGYGFHVPSGDTGPGGNGGGIFSEGILELDGCIVRNNNAGCGGNTNDGTPGSGGHGGGIYSSGTLALYDTTVTNNHAGNGGIFPQLPFTSGGGHGGGIFSLGSTELIRSTVSLNWAGNGGDPDGFDTPGGRGGGIYCEGDLILDEVEINGNRGGIGVMSEGGGIFHTSGILQVTTSVFTDNHALGDFEGNTAGGGIYSDGDITVSDSTFRENEGGYLGGGIYVSGSAEISRSTFIGNNAALNGAGICLDYDSSATISNSTFSGNVARFDPAVSGGSGVSKFGTGSVAITHSTFTGNIGAAIMGGVLLRNSIVAGNLDRNGIDYLDCGAGVISGDYNLVGSGTGCPVGGANDIEVSSSEVFTSVLDVNPGLNGGITPTHALLEGSPAINAGTCTDVDGNAVTEDQRGAPRPVGGACDIGSFELGERRVLVVTNDEPVGDNCPDGGYEIQVGMDENANGSLEPEEVEQTVYICHGSSGYISLVDVTTLGDGDENCPYGGQRIDVGKDADMNGMLSEEEIEHTVYVCHGSDGINQIVSVTPIAEGDDNCPNGGQRIDIGLDHNGDGVLSEEEIDSTSYVCNGYNVSSNGCGCGGVSKGEIIFFCLLFIVLAGTWHIRKSGLGSLKT